jgi:hypothetical protein
VELETLGTLASILVPGAAGILWVVRRIEMVGTKIEGFGVQFSAHVEHDHGQIEDRMGELTRRIDSIHNGHQYPNGG